MWCGVVPTPRPQQLNNKTNSQMGAQRGETILGPAELNPISNLGVLVQTLPAVVGVEREEATRGCKKKKDGNSVDGDEQKRCKTEKEKRYEMM